MPRYMILVDIFGAILVAIGFSMAFRQLFVRRLFGLKLEPRAPHGSDDEEDPLTYILRIAGIMIMVFGFALAMMTTMVYLT